MGNVPGSPATPAEQWRASPRLLLEGTRCTPVFVNVYHLVPGPMAALNHAAASGAGMGLGPTGAFHSGVEVFDKEWAFGGGAGNGCGIFATPPRKAIQDPTQFYQHHHVLDLPRTVTSDQIYQLATNSQLSSMWTANSYDMLNRNCNHFAETFVGTLIEKFRPDIKIGIDVAAEDCYPQYINRAAKIGRGMIPTQLFQMFGSAAPTAQSTGYSDHRQTTQSHETSSFSGTREAQDPSTNRENTAENSCNTANNTKPGHRTAEERAILKEALARLPVKELKQRMQESGISERGCIEKSDLIEAILNHT